jgi:hypothetical protein
MASRRSGRTLAELARSALVGSGCHSPTGAALGEHVCAGRAIIATRSARTRGRCAVYTVEQDETGGWSAHASLPGGGANGEGQTAEEGVADLREALDGWFAEFGVPDELTITVRDAA